MYARLGDGSLVVSDHFRNVVSCLPPENRSPDLDQLVEHYLCGWVYDRNTYSAAVKRLAVGDHFSADLAGDHSSIEVFDRFTVTSSEESIADVVDRVEAALEAAMAPFRGDPEVAMTFSGGVDSTLLATFLDSGNPLLTMMPDTPEFAAEREYAQVAAGLLGCELTPVKMFEADYLDLLEDTTDRVAAPPHHYVTPALAGLYKREESAFILGEGADSVFGSGRGMERVSGSLSSAPARFALKALEHAPGTIGRRAEQIWSYANAYAEAPDSLRSSVGRSLLFGDVEAIEKMVGATAVNRVLAGHLEALADRADFETPSSQSFFRQVEMRQIRHTIADLAFLDRHLGQTEGKRIALPFTDPGVVAALLRVPARRRYIKGVSGKWILKEILSRRLPDYPVNQRKLATGLPFERYYESGPLSGIWDRYDVPDFVNSIRGDIVAEPSAVTWNALTHAVWSERIERNADLEPIPPALTFRTESVLPSDA
jgi:asparagine synthetase B (glutamine-hydrolysing)